MHKYNIIFINHNNLKSIRIIEAEIWIRQSFCANHTGNNNSRKRQRQEPHFLLFENLSHPQHKQLQTRYWHHNSLLLQVTSLATRRSLWIRLVSSFLPMAVPRNETYCWVVTINPVAIFHSKLAHLWFLMYSADILQLWTSGKVC